MSVDLEELRRKLAGTYLDVSRSEVEALCDEVEHLRSLLPPAHERSSGSPGEGSWAVFAEKVVRERDEAVAAFHDATRLRSEIQQARIKAEDERDALRLLVHRMWSDAEHWTGPRASSHYRSEVAERIERLTGRRP